MGDRSRVLDEYATFRKRRRTLRGSEPDVAIE
jgi:hypothetical protein